MMYDDNTGMAMQILQARQQQQEDDQWERSRSLLETILRSAFSSDSTGLRPRQPKKKKSGGMFGGFGGGGDTRGSTGGVSLSDYNRSGGY